MELYTSFCNRGSFTGIFQEWAFHSLILSKFRGQSPTNSSSGELCYRGLMWLGTSTEGIWFFACWDKSGWEYFLPSLLFILYRFVYLFINNVFVVLNSGYFYSKLWLNTILADYILFVFNSLVLPLTSRQLSNSQVLMDQRTDEVDVDIEFLVFLCDHENEVKIHKKLCRQENATPTPTSTVSAQNIICSPPPPAPPHPQLP